MKTLSTLLAIALTVSAPVTTLADDGFFVAAGLGSAELSEDFDGFDVDASSTAYRIAVGWRFSEFLAIGGGYQNFGRFDQTLDIDGTSTEVSLKADGFTLGGIVSWPVGNRWSLFARAGAFFWDGDAEINDATEASPEDTNLYLGAGARVVLTERWSLTADGSRYALDDTSSTVVSIGIYMRL